MAQTHLELIESLGLAMSWLQKELKWGVPATELRHLCGRIGELYAAVITNGQMSKRTNEHGYDVVAGSGQKVSVKTTAMTGSSGHISFNESTLPLADRVMIFCLNTQEMQIDTLFDGTVEEVRCLLSPSGSGRLDLALSKLRKPVNIDLTKLKVVASASLEGYVINELENGSIQAFENGNGVDVVLPVLRKLAASLGLPIANDNGNPYNTRSLGTMVIKAANGKASGQEFASILQIQMMMRSNVSCWFPTQIRVFYLIPMPFQNRVLPDSSIVAGSQYGGMSMVGKRGCPHNNQRELVGQRMRSFAGSAGGFTNRMNRSRDVFKSIHLSLEVSSKCWLGSTVVEGGWLLSVRTDTKNNTFAGSGEKIPIRTTFTACFSGHYSSNKNALHQVDQAVIFGLNNHARQVATLYNSTVTAIKRSSIGYNLPRFEGEAERWQLKIPKSISSPDPMVWGKRRSPLDFCPTKPIAMSF